MLLVQLMIMTSSTPAQLTAEISGTLLLANMSFRIGQRVIEVNDKVRGTVKYVGQVDGTKGSWIGIDWDDPHRGKHNGSHGDKHYFTTRTPTSGSFVRDSKVSKGVTFEEAVEGGR